MPVEPGFLGRSAMVLVEGKGDQLTSNGDHVHGFKSLLWALYTAFTVAPFALFATTRYTTTATRTAYSVAVGAHLLFQMISIALCADSWYGDTQRMMLQAGGLLALAVPAWVVYRQSVLRTKTLAGVA